MTKHLSYLLLSLMGTVFVQASLKVLSESHSGDIVSAIKDYRFLPILGLYGMAMVAWFYAASKIEFTVLIPFNILTLYYRLATFTFPVTTLSINDARYSLSFSICFC